MKQWLLNIRQPGKRYTVWEGIRRVLLCLVLGILLGMLAKQLDLASYGGNSFWDRALKWLDLRNFLSDLPFWLAVGLAIAVFAPSAFQAGDGVFFFFLGMCGAYHWYSVYVGGFNPSGYMRIWYGLTVVSPLLGALSWYARGKGYVAAGLTTLIFTVLLLSCFYAYQTVPAPASDTKNAHAADGCRRCRRQAYNPRPRACSAPSDSAWYTHPSADAFP